MANASIAALRLTRNDVENLTSIFKCLFEYVQHDTVNNNSVALQCKQNCLTAIETLLSLGYRAISEHGLYIEVYQKHFQNFLLSSCFEKQANIISIDAKFNSFNSANSAKKSSAALTASFMEIFLLTLNVFSKLDKPDYYQDFVSVTKALFAQEVLQQAGLSATAASLAEIFF